MQDYETLYYQLFNGVSDVILELQQLQQQVEEAYISGRGDPQAMPADNVLYLPLRRLRGHGALLEQDKPGEPVDRPG